MNIHTIILAAGKGTRMNTNLPKVMQSLGGQTLISHVIKTAKCFSKDITIIVGHQKDLLKEHIADIDQNIQTADQNKQLGTAHAVKTASHLIKDDEKVLVLYGDVPLIRSETIEALINSGQDCTLLSMKLNDPTGYGRIMTNKENLALRIIEHKDASDDERQIQEVFTGIFLIDGSLFRSALDEINKQYVITARAKGCSKSRVLYGHIFRNAMLLVLAGLPAALIGIFFTGSMLIEVIFSLDGLGLLSFESVITRDYPVIFGSLYIFTLVGLVLKLISDVTYTLIDPRITFEGQ